MLHDPARHEPLCKLPWNEPAARRFMQALADQACQHFDPLTLWRTHPRDLEPGEAALPIACLYLGAAGVIWALQHLKRHADVSVELDFTACIDGLIEHNRRFNVASGIESPSYLFGDAGVLLLQWRATRSVAVAQSLFDTVQANLRNPSLEPLLGSSGTMVAALHMLEATREERWQQLFCEAAQILCDQMHLAAGFDNTWIWTQLLYGKRIDYLGAGHGFAGNMFPFVRGAQWLPPPLVETMTDRAAQVFRISALTEDDRVNWQPVFDHLGAGLPSKLLLQDCHGAPGIICRLAGSPSPALRALLRQAGEAVWAAGPRPVRCCGWNEPEPSRCTRWRSPTLKQGCRARAATRCGPATSALRCSCGAASPVMQRFPRSTCSERPQLPPTQRKIGVTPRPSPPPR